VTPSGTTPPSRPGRGSEDRARLADALRDARRKTGLSGEEAGRRAGLTQTKVSRLERGVHLPTVDDTAALCRAYAITGQARDELLALAAGLRQEQSSRVVLARNTTRLGQRIAKLEANATRIRSFQPMMVIGLLQTPAYQELVFGVRGSGELSFADATAAIAQRTARQTILADARKELVLLMTEGALRWHVGSPQLMADQIHAIIDAMRWPNVCIGVIPWTTAVDVFPANAFHLYDDDAVIAATETATATLTGQADIATYIEAFTAFHEAAVFDDQARTELQRIETDYLELTRHRQPNGSA
jgi:transcriptional regulator with XRE-family HTH domain